MKSGHGLQVSEQVALPFWPVLGLIVREWVFCFSCGVGPPNGKAGRHLILPHYVFQMFVFVLFLSLAKTFIKRSHNDFFTGFYRYSSKNRNKEVETHTLFSPARPSHCLLIYLAHICGFLLIATHPLRPMASIC